MICVSIGRGRHRHVIAEHKYLADHGIRLVELRLDCDGDALLALVDQAGAACHTGRRSCFYRAARDGALAVIADPIADPAELYGRSEAAP